MRELKQGDFFTLKRIEAPKENQVYIRREYDREQRKYWAQKFDDCSSGKLIPGDKEVFTDFVF